LTPAEATALALVSVFVSDFSAEDAQAVLSDLFDAAALQNMLRALMERHLLVSSSDASDSGSRRFAMLDAVRAFARREALADGRWVQVQRHHAWHFHRVAETAWQGVSQGRTGDVRSAFQAAAADIEQSLHWMHEHASAEDYLRGCWQRAVLLLTFGSLREAIDSLHEATRVAVESSGEKGQSAWCHYLLSRAEVLAGRSRAAMRPIRAARSLARGSSDEALQSRIDRHLARLALGQLRLGAARRLIEKSVARSQRLERLDLLSHDHGNLSLCSSMSGDYSSASAVLELAIDYALQARDAQLTLLAMLGVATVETALGRLDRAQDALRECMPLLNAGYTEYLCLHVALIKGELAFEQARFDDAHQQFSSALEHCRTKLPERALVARLWHDFLLVESGRPSEAVTLLALSERELAFDCDFSDFFFRALTYQLRLQADRQDWPAVQGTLARLEPRLWRAGNPLWMSWLAQSAAVVAHDLGRGELAGELLAQSRVLQLEHGFLPTPRQTASWEQQQARLMHRMPRCSAAGADVLAALLEQLRLDLGHWAHKPSPQSRRKGLSAAHELLMPVEGSRRERAELRVA
jgi:tetratricopeptide (TPR) repeat protein